MAIRIIVVEASRASLLRLLSGCRAAAAASVIANLEHTY